MDASVAIGWVHPGQANADASALLDAMAAGATIEVPALWSLEVANALTVLVRRRKLAADERSLALGWLRGLPLRVDHDGAALAFSVLSELAFRFDLSVYDATYLELAIRRRLPLACADGPLRSAASKTGVELSRRPRRPPQALSPR